MKTIMRSPAFTIALFVLAAVLIGFGTVGAVQAAPSIASNDYNARVTLSDIDTALYEKGEPVEGDDTLMKSLLADNGDEKLKVGKTYKYGQLVVHNTGSIDEYVRVTVRAYWWDGNKVLDVDPTTIKLEFGKGWTIDEEATNANETDKGERTVLYYSNYIVPGEDTAPIIDSVTIDKSVVTAVTDRNYDYDGLEFRVEVEADAVQTHSGEKAMTSAWGRTI